MKVDLSNYFKDFDALLISSPGNVIYLTGYSGFSVTERECFLLLTKSKKYLITDKRYSQAVREIPGFEIIDSGATSFLAQNEKLLGSISTLGIEENDLRVSEYRLIKKRVGKLLNFDLNKLREIKSEAEIEKLKSASKLADEAFEFAINKLKVGISEKELSIEIIWFLKSKKADISFTPIVAFGPNSAIPHHLPEDTKLSKNTIVLLDLGASLENYCSDLTRTIFFGKAPKKFIDMHSTVLQAQKLAISKIKPGGKASEIDKVARDYIISKGFPNIGHSVGHGVGVEVHEAPHLSPNSHDIVSERMVFSVEPGIYLPGYGGVRIEDLVLVTDSGAQLISHSNQEIIEV